MSFLSFFKKFKSADTVIDKSLWDNLDALHEKKKHKEHHSSKSKPDKTEMDVWDKLDTYYEKQEAKLHKLSRRKTISDVGT